MRQDKLTLLGTKGGAQTDHRVQLAIILCH